MNLIRQMIVTSQFAPVACLVLLRWICDEVEPSLEIQDEHQETSLPSYPIERQVSTSHIGPTHFST